MAGGDIVGLAGAAIERASARGVWLVTAESCTGGLVAAALISVPGSSLAVDGGYVAYSNASKHRLLGVPTALIEANGAVSREVVMAMAEGAADVRPDRLAVAVTGIAGPGGGNEAKPVGLVWFATALGGDVRAEERRFGDVGRDRVRTAAVRVALELMLERLEP